MTPLTRNLTIALVVSVVLNVFFVGFSAARFFRHGESRPEITESDPSGPMRSLWKKHGAALGPRHESVERARRAVHDALVAEPFQASALELALAALRHETDETQVALHRAIVEAASGLSVEERRKLAESRWMGAGPRGPAHHW